MSPDPLAAARRAAGIAAAGLVENGMRVGLGTGSTAAAAIGELGRRVAEEGLRFVGVATSFAAERLGRLQGIDLAVLDDPRLASESGPRLDLALDGADEVDPALTLIKGRGAAHTRERVVAALAQRFVVLVDSSKLVEQLGTRSPVPVEVLPMAAPSVEHSLRTLGGEPVLREGGGKDGPVVTDQGFWILDARFPGIDDAAGLAEAIRGIPGVLDHGIFVGLASEALVGLPDGSVSRRLA
jgi:ribose 5-phosphate isomerase A